MQWEKEFPEEFLASRGQLLERTKESLAKSLFVRLEEALEYRQNSSLMRDGNFAEDYQL